MASPFTTVSVTSFNASPPADDGTVVGTNQLKWSTIKTKLADPLNTAIASIVSNITAAFGKTLGSASLVSTAIDYTADATDQGRLIVFTAAGTLTTPDATVVGAPFAFDVLNSSTDDVVLDGHGTQTVNGALTLTLEAGAGGRLQTDGTNWFYVGPQGFVAPASTAKTGDLKMKVTSTADTGWVPASGRTIGNVASSATERANADTAALYSQLWTDYANTLLAIQDSSGSGSTRGVSAAADYAANKRLPLPDMRDRVPMGKANMGGTDAALIADVDATVLGQAMGAEKVTLVAGNLPDHVTAVAITDPTHVHGGDHFAGGTFGAGGGGAQVMNNQSTTNTAAAATGITAAGSFGTTERGGAISGVNKMPPSRVVNYFIKL